MCATPLARWHQLVQDRNPDGLATLLSEQVVFHSPVVHTPQVGKAITTQYLIAAFHVFFNESFRYVREVVGAGDAVLEFEVEIEGESKWPEHAMGESFPKGAWDKGDLSYARPLQLDSLSPHWDGTTR